MPAEACCPKRLYIYTTSLVGQVFLTSFCKSIRCFLSNLANLSGCSKWQKLQALPELTVARQHGCRGEWMKTCATQNVESNVLYIEPCSILLQCANVQDITGYYTWNLDMANAWSPCIWSIIAWEDSGGLCSMLLQRQSCSLPFHRTSTHHLPTSTDDCNRVTILAMTGLEIPEACLRKQPLHAWTKLWK